MKKKLTGKILMMMCFAIVGICSTTGKAQAKSTMLSSRGNIVYQDARGKAELYTEDVFLLKEKLDTISGETFSPRYYAHVHQWEYTDCNERTHTRHCKKCGDAFDLTDSHHAVKEENFSISWEDKKYPGRRYSCECGQQWVLEAAHALVFDEVDEVCHRSRCVLEETGYCRGYEPVSEEHYAYYYVSDPDEEHHEKVCMDCGYRTEETCSYILEGGTENADASGRYCLCGNRQQEPVGVEAPAEAERSEQGRGEDTSEDTASDQAVPDGTVSGDTVSDEEAPKEPTPEDTASDETTPKEPVPEGTAADEEASKESGTENPVAEAGDSISNNMTIIEEEIGYEKGKLFYDSSIFIDTGDGRECLSGGGQVCRHEEQPAV